LDGAGIPPDRVAEESLSGARISLHSPKRKADMTVVWIIIAVLALLALFWVFSRRRSRA
jgi:hypothetical protein